MDESIMNEYLQNSYFKYKHFNRSELYELLDFDFKKILDVGCNTGGFGSYVKQMNPDAEVWGIEPNEDAVRIAQNVLDKVINGLFDQSVVELQNERFDIICFNDVLEHMTNPFDALHYAKQLLSDGGYILASIPNILYYPVFVDEIIMQEDWKYVDAGTLDQTHLRFFTKKSIIRLFGEAGLKIKIIQGINATITPEYEILNKMFSNKLSDWKFLQFAVLAELEI